MENIIKMEDPASVRSVANRLDRLGDSLLDAQAEIGGAARGMDWDGSAKDNFVQDVDAWGGKIRSLSTRCNEKYYAVLMEVEEWENAAKGFVTGYTPFITGENDSSAADESDIAQGNIGDCFLMSSMGAIALQHPELIERMIHDNGDGTYTVTFWDARCLTPFGPCTYTPYLVTVDGNFPEKLSDPKDSVGGTQEAWTMILEKAYGKFVMEKLKKDPDSLWVIPSPSIALSAMTGKDCANYPSELMSMDTLYESFQRGDAITAGSQWPANIFRPDEYFGKSNKIAEGHVYFVTGVDPVNNTVTVQNPWPDCPPITMSFEDYQKCFWLTTSNPVV
jgi:hypothetical protein